MRGVFAFLELPDFAAGSMPRYNSSGVPRSRIMRSLVAFARRQPALRGALRALSTGAVREKLRSSNVEKAAMAPLTRDRLQRELSATRPWVEELIGRRLDAWG